MATGPANVGKAWRNVALSIVIGGASLLAIAHLSLTVSHDLRLLASARSDNVQWTLSQSEVEFLDFNGQLVTALQDADPDLQALRRSFDIFYSRIATLSQSDLYRGLLDLPDFEDPLARVQAFLAAALPLIDAGDADLAAGLGGLKQRADALRADVRSLSNAGLGYFAKASDQRRAAVATTLTQLAAAVGFLILILVFLAIYLAILNAQNVRRRAEIAQAGERMKIVTGTALDAVIVSDETGRILEFNAAAETIFGHLADAVIGQDLGALIVPEHHRAAHAAGMARMRHTGESRVVGKGRVTLEAKRASGEVFPVELAIQSAETADGRIFIAFLRDISYRVRAERELVAARDRAVAGEKTKTDFLATMSHEIRTPLNGLLGNLTLLQDTPLSPEQSHYIRNMNTSGRLLMSHISDVLDITKFDAGKLVLRPFAMNLDDLLRDIVDSQRGAARANGTVLDWAWIGAPVPWIEADGERLQHIVMNLLGNAVKYTHAGRITVALERVAGEAGGLEIRIGVRDTGIGIAEAVQARIFDDFVTGDSAYDRELGGSGLGLGIARRFAQALGGRIGLESREGEGSHFWVQIPVVAIDPPAAAQAVAAPGEPAQGRKILVVEDNEINRLVAREMLRRAGHLVTEAHDGKAGVRMADTEAFDLILMDISMPVMDGRSAARAIRAGTGPCAGTPIVALTANAMREEQEAFLADGMNAVLTKPLSRDALAQVVMQWAVPMPAPPVDVPHLQELRDTVGAQAYGALLARFCAETDALIDSLATAAEADDLGKRAHKIAGSAATFGATDLRAGLVALETAAGSGDRDAVVRAVAALAPLWAVTRAALELPGPG